MKTDNKKISTLKTVLIIAAATFAGFLITALILALPRINAENKLATLKDLITSQSVDSIVIYQHTPYETGTFDQVAQVLEKRLDSNEADEFIEKFIICANSSEYIGTSESYYAMTDYKILLTHDGQRSVFYVSSDSIYILNERMKTAFSCKDSSLYEYLDSLKKAHFKKQ